MKKLLLVSLLVSSCMVQSKNIASLVGSGLGLAGLVGTAYVGAAAHQELAGESKGTKFSKVKDFSTKLTAAGISTYLAGTIIDCPSTYSTLEMSVLAASFIWLAGKDQKRAEKDKYKNIKRFGGIIGASASATAIILVTRIFGYTATNSTSFIRNAQCLGMFVMTSGMVAGRALAEKLAKQYHAEEQKPVAVINS